MRGRRSSPTTSPPTSAPSGVSAILAWPEAPRRPTARVLKELQGAFDDRRTRRPPGSRSPRRNTRRGACKRTSAIEPSTSSTPAATWRGGRRTIQVCAPAAEWSSSASPRSSAGRSRSPSASGHVARSRASPFASRRRRAPTESGDGSRGPVRRRRPHAAAALAGPGSMVEVLLWERRRRPGAGAARRHAVLLEPGPRGGLRSHMTAVATYNKDEHLRPTVRRARRRPSRAHRRGASGNCPKATPVGGTWRPSWAGPGIAGSSS